MSDSIDPEQIGCKIQRLKQAVGELHQEVQNCPALAKNLERILVNIKMLELNVSDVVDLESQTDEKGSA